MAVCDIRQWIDISTGNYHTIISLYSLLSYYEWYPTDGIYADKIDRVSTAEF